MWLNILDETLCIYYYILFKFYLILYLTRGVITIKVTGLFTLQNFEEKR